MDLYEKIRELAKLKGISINQLEKELGFARSYISKLRTVKPNADFLQKIAERLGVGADFLLGNSTGVSCNECGYYYNPLIETDRKEHEIIHKKWQSAVKKYGFCWTYQESEDIRNRSISIIGNKNLTDDEIIKAFEDCVKAEFSNSLRNSGYDQNHLSYKDFFAKQLGNWDSKDSVSEEVYKKLVDKYGVIYDEQPKYYLNDETTKIAQEVFDNKELRLLFDASRNAKPEDIKFAAEMILKLKAKENYEE